MVATGMKLNRDNTLDVVLVVAILLIFIGIILSLVQTLLPLASLLLALRIYLTSRDGNVRRITGVLMLFFGASFLSTAAWYVLPNVVDSDFLQSDNYKIASGMFWFVGYVAVAWILTNLKNSKQWYIERGLDRLITAVGAVAFFAILLYTLLNLPLTNGHVIDLPIVLGYLCAGVVLLLETLRLARREKQRWFKYLIYAGSLFFAANVVYASYQLIGLPFVNSHAIDIFILLAYLFTDVVILVMTLKLTQMNLPRSLRYLVYAIFAYFAIASVGDLVYETRFLFHLKYLFSLTAAGSQLTLLTQDATDIIYNVALLVMSSMLFLYAPFSFLTPVRDDIVKRLSDTQLFVDNLIAKSPDATCIFDRDGRLILVNDRFLDLYGLRREVVTGGQFNIFSHVSSRVFQKDVFKELNKVQKGETVILPKIKMRGIKGGRQEDFYIYLKMFPTYSSEGQVANYVLIIEDITERTLAEEALKASERRNAALLDAIPDIMFILSPEGDYLDFKATDTSILAIPPEQIIGKNIRDAGFDEVMLTSFRGHLKQAVETRQLQQFDYVLAVPSGLRSFEARLIALTDREVLCIVRDITERKQAAEALRESEERLRLCAATARFGTFEWDLAHDRHVWSVETYDIYGVPVGRPMTLDFLKGMIYPGDEQDDVLAAGLDPAGPGGYTMEYRIRRASDGEVRWVYMRTRVLFAGEGAERRAVRVLGAVQDITERKRAEEALRESEEKFRVLAETSPAGICMFRGDRFIYVNPAVERISGYSREEFGHMVLWDLVAPEGIDHMKEALAKRMSGGSLPSHYELPFRTKSKEIKWVGLSIGSVNIGGDPAFVVSAFDITERKRAEEALRESEEKFRALTEMAPVAICILQDDKFKYANPAMGTISGYGNEELLTLDFMDMVHPAARKYIEGQYGKWLSGDGNAEFRSMFMGVRKDGKVCWIDLSRKTIDFEGRPALLLTGIDVTERKRAEEALRESEEKYRALVDEISDWICEVDERFTCTYSSPRVKDVLGYEPGEVIGRSAFDFLAPGEADRLLAMIPPGFEPPGAFAVIECKLLRKDGRIIRIEASGQSVTDSEGRFKCNRATIRDVTERKRSEEALRESEARLAKAQTIAHLGNWEWDVDGARGWWSDELYDIFGVDKTKFELNLDNIMSGTHPDDRPWVDRAIKAIALEGKPINLDFRVIRPDGSERTVHFEGELARDANGRPVKIFGIGQDITERVQLEEELFNAYTSLKEMYERKMDFTNAAAHELRTPLTPIIGYTDILKSEVTDERHRKYLEIIERNALRQKALVNRMLELASLDAGMMQVRKSEFSVLPLACEVADNYRTINPHIAVDVGPGLQIYTDPDILRHVLDNLVSNAVKYSDHSQPIEIRARETGHRYEFSVADYGPGIPRAEWGKIFERFYLVGGDRDNRTGGRIGLGLALVKAYVTLLGGEVWLESELGLGSTFYFTVPKTS